ELAGHQPVDHRAAHLDFEAPQAPGLRRRESQPRHLMEFSANPPSDYFKVHVCLVGVGVVNSSRRTWTPACSAPRVSNVIFPCLSAVLSPARVSYAISPRASTIDGSRAISTAWYSSCPRVLMVTTSGRPHASSIIR